MPSQSLRTALLPLSLIYASAARLRAALYRAGIFRSRKLDGIVISVGNLTVGGTGKTPMVIWLAERLAAEGHRPAILTRGYRGGAQSDANGIPMSDEVAMLRERLGASVQLGVGKNRYATGRTLEQHGASWFILDDGFQHLALRRDVDIVLLDSNNPFSSSAVLPAGRLREPRTALKRASIVVLTRTDHAPALETVVRRYTVAPIFYAQTELDAVLRAPGLTVPLPETEQKSARFFAFCGIGNPNGFFDDLRRWGFPVVGRRGFRDHHRYSPDDTSSLLQEAAASHADAFLCTEKDLFNLRDVIEQIRLPVYICRIRLALTDETGFWDAIQAEIRRHRSGQVP